MAVAALVVVALAACGPTDTPAPADGSNPPGSAATSAAPPKASLPVNGRCVLIPTEKAATLIGSTPKSSATSVTGDAGITHVDGCTHTGTTSNLGYDINDFAASGQSPTVFIDRAASAMAAAPGVEKFDVPLGDKAIGFTVPVGSKVMGRIEIAKGSLTIAVNATSPDAATSKRIALAAAQLLVAAVG
jgi:hypothetical protein